MNEIKLIRYALEKQIPKRPIVKKFSNGRWWYCPSCYPEARFRVYNGQNFCRYCGQCIDWD